MSVDMQREALNAKLMLVALVVFVMSGCYSWNEFRYAIWGRTTEAEVASARVEQFRGRRRTYEKLVVRYAFDEEGGMRRQESMKLPPDTAPPVGTVPIRYVAGRAGMSRHVNDFAWLPVTIFVAALIAAGIFVLKMHHLANRPPTWRGKPVR